MVQYEGMSLEKKLALALEKTKESLSLCKEPIAIIGMSCRFTQAKNINEFWRLLEQGKDGINDIPPDRWDVSEYYDSNPDALGLGSINQSDQFSSGGSFVKKENISVLIIHSIAGKPGEVIEFAEALAHKNFTILIPQLASHGSSYDAFKGSRLIDWHESIEKSLEFLSQRCDSIFIAGFCSGAHLAVKVGFDTRTKISGVILLSPMLFLNKKARWGDYAAILALFTLLKYIVRLKNEYPSLNNSTRNAAIQSMKNAPLIHPYIPGVVVFELFRLTKEVKRILPKFNIPTLILHSMDDTEAGIKNPEYIKHKMKNNNVKIKYIKDSDHFITIDNQRELVSKYAADFIISI